VQLVDADGARVAHGARCHAAGVAAAPHAESIMGFHFGVRVDVHARDKRHVRIRGDAGRAASSAPAARRSPRNLTRRLRTLAFLGRGRRCAWIDLALSRSAKLCRFQLGVR
jgi:hypothetical protein